MILEKGGGGIENTTLFGKYQLCRVLGQGRSGTVYLAKHMELEEYRAIKQVPKSSAGYHQFRKEALILKSLRHPGIPMVYDLEEDEQYSYLIEEYLEGDSLYTLISETGKFSKAMTLSYGIQICRLVYKLHIATPNPILYLDLQPKNLLLCRHVVKLVDFDHAVHLEEAECVKQRYGTVGFAAPEQYTGEALDERTDVYAIGAVLYYMLIGQYPQQHSISKVSGAGKALSAVICKCLARDKKNRFQSVKEIMERLEQLQDREQGVFKRDQESSLTIAVAGAKSGVGTTHIAMGLAVFLSRQGMQVLYEERTASGAVRQMAACFNARADAYGIYRILGQSMMMCYGEAVKLKSHGYPVIVRDYGSACSKVWEEQADAVVLVLSGTPWQWEADQNAFQILGGHPRLAIVLNHVCRQLKTKLPDPGENAYAFLMPNFPNPFRQNRNIQILYREVLAFLFGKEGGIRSFFKRNGKARLFGRLVLWGSGRQ